jgi:magnesium-transporting ATPase (P-type)
MDIFSRRLEESVAYIIVLWLVTGVFGSVFTTGLAEYLVKKENFTYKISGNTILLISVVAIIPAIVIMSRGNFLYNPKEFTLLLSNGYVWVSYFVGAGTMAAILRNLGK